MGIHIERKHKFQYNPIPDMKQGPPNGSKLFHPQYEPPDGSKLFRPQKPEYSNYRLEQNDFADPTISFGDSKQFQNVIQEIKKWNHMQITYLLISINNLPNFR